MDLQHSKSFAAFKQVNRQLFKPKPLPLKQNQYPSQICAGAAAETCRPSNQVFVTPSTNDNDSQYLSLQTISQQSINSQYFKSYRISTETITSSPIDQIQLIIRENEKLKRSLNQKQKIIDTLTKSKETIKLRPRLELHDLTYLKKNSRSLVQPQSQHDAIKPSYVEPKQSISQNYNKRTKLPKIEDCSTEEECNFTFANNFFRNDGAEKINFKQVFAQSHLKKKFFT